MLYIFLGAGFEPTTTEVRAKRSFSKTAQSSTCMLDMLSLNQGFQEMVINELMLFLSLICMF